MDKIMENEQIVHIFDKLSKTVSCDFVGLAFQNRIGPNVRWHFTLGNQNDKYERIAVRYGKGLAGKVIATGSPIYLDNFPEQIQGKVLEYAIMLAEKLVSAYAVPLFYNGLPRGVLLVGRRKKLPFFLLEQQEIIELSKEVEKVIITLMHS